MLTAVRNNSFLLCSTSEFVVFLMLQTCKLRAMKILAKRQMEEDLNTKAHSYIAKFGLRAN